MPSTIRDIFTAAGLEPAGCVRWGTTLPEAGPGVYAVALSSKATTVTAEFAQCPLSPEAIERLLSARPELRLDGRRPTPAELAARLRGLWLADEAILYIGLAGTSLRRRVGDYYSTPLGARRPHAGGWPLKTLDVLPELWVHYASCETPRQAEEEMLGAFIANTSPGARNQLHDAALPLPFANLQWGPGKRKNHGIIGVREPSTDRTGSSASRPARPLPAPTAARSPGPDLQREKRTSALPHAGPMRSQRITEKDIERGQLRFPAPAKAAFPDSREDLLVQLRGLPAAGRWDPRNGPDRQRSGLLRLGRQVLEGRVRSEEVLSVSVQHGRIHLD